MYSFSSFWQVLHDNTMRFTEYLHILHHLQAMKMTFWKLFLTCKSKNPNLAEKSTSLAENLLKSWTPWSSWSSFFQVCLPPASRLPLPASCLLPPASCLLPPASCLLPPASCLLPPASCLLPPASCLLPPAACLLPPVIFKIRLFSQSLVKH
jgi:hypothetical protein